MEIPVEEKAAAWSHRDWVLALLLLISTVLAYQRALTGQAIWDDDRHLTAPGLRSLNGLERIWFKPGATEQYYPLVHTVFWVEHRVWGDWNGGYHLVNVLLHVVAALLLLKILRTLGIPGSWLAAAIFALHPVQVESVAWMTELKNTLSGVFYFAAILIYLRFDRTRQKTAWAAALILFILGLLSKTAILTLPAALLVVFWWQRGKLSLQRDVLPLVPFFAVGIVSGLPTSWIELHIAHAQGGEFHLGLIEQWLVAGRALCFYLGKLIYPVDLMFSYPRWQVNPSVGWQYLFPMAIVLLLAVLWVLRRRSRGPLAAMLFFAGTLVPTLGFFNVYAFRYSFVADHWQYLACAGPVVLAAAALHRWGRKVSIPLLLVLGALTWRQCGMYANAETVWRTTLARNPESWMAHNNLGALLLLQGRLDDAIQQFKISAALQPDSLSAQDNLGKALLEKRRPAEAIPYLQKALALQPDYAEGHNNLANALLQLGKLDEALAEIQKALALRPGFPEAYFNLGEILLKKGADAGTLNTVAWSLATRPDPLFRNGAEAVRLASRAVQLTHTNDPDSLDTLAAAYAETAHFTEAAQTAALALKLARRTGNAAMISDMEKRLQLYEKSQPYREPK